MPCTPEIIEAQPQMMASLHMTIPREEIARVMGPALGEVMRVLADQDIEPAGPWFTHHLRMEPGIFDFEVCVPVSRPIIATGNVQPGEWPAMRVARTHYRGPYSGLAGAWHEFDAWLTAEGHSADRDLWERYLEGPDSTRNPAQFVTELNRPLKS